MAVKKTLYELLEIDPGADDAAIRAAYARLTQALDAQQVALGHEEYVQRGRLLRVAFHTLINPQSRAGYDAEQAARRAPEPGLQLVPITPPPEATALRTDAMLLRAEAIALRASALELKATTLDGGGSGGGVSGGGFGGGLGGGLGGAAGAGGIPPGGRALMHQSPQALMDLPKASPQTGGVPALLGWFSGATRRIVLWLGTFVAVGMMLQMCSVYSSSKTGAQMAEQRRLAEEKTYLQDYYQTHGVRPASMAEAKQLDEQRRREEAAQRQQQEAERQRAYQEAKEQRFEEESQRRAEQVTSNLQYTEEQARQQARYAQEREEERRLEAKREREETERRRLEAQQAEWQRTLSR